MSIDAVLCCFRLWGFLISCSFASCGLFCHGFCCRCFLVLWLGFLMRRCFCGLCWCLGLLLAGVGLPAFRVRYGGEVFE